MNDNVEMLTQPLTTEEGFLNEACLNELEAANCNVQPTYDRLSNDPEWSTPRITHWRDILGYFANWSVRQISYPDTTPFPPGLEKMIGYLSARIRPCFDNTGYAHLSLCDINKMLHNTLMCETIFQSWNDSATFQGWLDLDALLHNVCLSIRSERREFDAFNKKFDEERDE
jgi:hypothetical protein